MRPQAKPFVVEIKKVRRRKGPTTAGDGVRAFNARPEAIQPRRPAASEVRK